MSVPLTADSSGPAVTFRDGLGDRVPLSGPDGRALEVLRLRAEFLTCAGFEFAVRERASALNGFRDPVFTRVYRVDRLRSGARELAILSDRAPGTRLSTLLEAAAGVRPVVAAVAVASLRQLVPAVTRLRRHGAGVAHGALAAERVVVGADGRLTITEPVLGSALDRLGLSRRELWRGFRVAVPPSAGPVRIDERADVVGIASIGLALLAGRPLDPDEYPEGIARLAKHVVQSCGGVGEELPEDVAVWLYRALQFDPRRAFVTVAEAEVAWQQTGAASLDESEARRTIAAWAAGHTGRAVRQTARPTAGRAPVRVPEPPSPARQEPRVAPSSRASSSRSRVRPSVQPAPRLIAPLPSSADLADPDQDAEAWSEEGEGAEASGTRARRRAWRWVVTAAVVLVTIGTVSVAATRRHLSRATVAPQFGTLSLASTPAGVDVFVDGLPRGVTPVELNLSPGAHIVELRGRGVPRVIPVTIVAGERSTERVRLSGTESSQAVGQLSVRSDPPGAVVTVDGETRGATPITILGLAPGAHTVLLDRNGVIERHEVEVRPGATVSLDAPSQAPAVPSIGWLDIEAPVDVELRDGSRSLGVVRRGRIELAPGRHDLAIVNETLGYREERSVNVVAGRTTRLVVRFPPGSVHLNARPWAAVWMDGERIGDTPIGNLAVPIGPHEFVFKHPEFGEKRYAVAVTLAAPVHLTVDMRQ